MAGYNARFRVDADKRRGLRVVLVEPRQFSAKRLDVRCNYMAGISLGVGKGLELLCVNPDAEVPSVFLGVVLLPALGQQCAVVVVAVSLMAPPVDAATRCGELERDAPYLQSFLDPAQCVPCLDLLFARVVGVQLAAHIVEDPLGIGGCIVRQRVQQGGDFTAGQCAHVIELVHDIYP